MAAGPTLVQLATAPKPKSLRFFEGRSTLGLLQRLIGCGMGQEELYE